MFFLCIAEVIGRLSPVVAPQRSPADDAVDLDDGSDSSTSGCSSLSFTAANAGANIPTEDTNRRPAEVSLNRPNFTSSIRPSLQQTSTATSAEKTRDAGVTADQSSIVAETC